MSGLSLYSQFIQYLYSSGDLSVPKEFHEQCVKIKSMFANDVSGVVATLTDYSINSASEAVFKIECSDETVEDLLNFWLQNINVNINGVPSGLQELAKEYYKERWQGSSLCLMKVEGWKKISIGNNSINVPTILYFVNGSSVYIKREEAKNYKLGSDKFFFDEAFKNPVTPPNGNIIVNKPFGRWFDQYPSPYTVKKGVLQNWLAIEKLSAKGNQVIQKFIPYLFTLKKGDKDAFLKELMECDDDEVKTAVDNFKTAIERYENEGAKVPIAGVTYDQEFSHLIPDLTKILSEELYRQGYRALLSGLGFMTVVQGVGDTRKEETISPKPFIAEVNTGISDFKSVLIDVIRLIIDENKIDHRKLFSDNKSLKIVNTPIKINVQLMLDAFRSAYVYGTITIETYQEILNIDPEQELERMKKEWSNGLREIYQPHLIQNTEAIEDVSPTTKKQVEKDNEKTKKQLQKATLVTCKKCNKQIDYLSQPESGIGYIKCPECGTNIDQEGNFAKVINEPIDPNLETAPYKNLDQLPSYIKKMTVKCQETFMATFNEVYNDSNDESKAMAIGISAAKRCMKKQGYEYNKEKKEWVKKEEK
jgi:DNA-directed RNA polymerase subunit RPC12/RpoP